MAEMGPLYLGLDLSTQQLKAIVIDSSLKVKFKSEFNFDTDSHGFNVTGGVISNGQSHEVYAPIAMWLQALDSLLNALKGKGLNFGLVKGISGACQQHGSVFWSAQGVERLGDLDPSKGLEEQLDSAAFSHPYSPNWQDTSTQAECDEFDKALGSPQALAEATGSSAHHRFTGPQILRFHRHHPDSYKRTARISLVSSFLASLFLGKIAPIDVGDVCGMNLWHIKDARWDSTLVKLSAGSENGDDLLQKLGDVSQSGGNAYGLVSPYFVERYAFDTDCQVIPFTGDNPATILSLPLRPMDAIVSLGTSTTFLMSTPEYKPDASVHFMNHPTTPGLYMFMLCYKNGGLAREKVRDAINRDDSKSWERYEQSVLSTPRLGIRHPSDEMKLGLYFPLPEIVPRLQAGDYRFTYEAVKGRLTRSEDEWWTQHDSRAMIEGQMLSLRLRSHDLVQSPVSSQQGVPPQPRRIYLVGGGSKSPAITRVASEVLGGVEGVYRLDVGENACALGAAYKAVWGCERQEGQSFEDLIGQRWREEDFAEKVEDGYEGGTWEKYASALKGFEQMEQQLLKEQGSD